MNQDEYTSFCKPGYGKCIQIIRLQGGYTQEEFAEEEGVKIHEPYRTESLAD